MRALERLYACLEKKNAQEKQASGKSLEEGKKPMSFAVYRLLCEKLLKSDTADALFAHTYLVLEWNLMSRAHIVGDMDVAHIKWRLPCILFGEKTTLSKKSLL